MTDQKQHTEFKRKINLRRTLLEKAGNLQGAYYIPFIGEGDIAVELYQGHHIFGADIKPPMVKRAKERLPGAEIITADCDKYPFKKGIATFNLADFDSYSYPYDSFRSFWETAKIGSHCVIFFTDGQKQAIIRSGSYRTPDGIKQKARTKAEKREAYNFYFNKVILPWFKEYIKPYKIAHITKYLRAGSMCYWGAIVVRPNNNTNNTNSLHNHNNSSNNNKVNSERRAKFDDTKKEQYLEYLRNGHHRGYAASMVGVHRATVSIHMNKDSEFAKAVSEAESDASGKVEHALFEAATRGNVTAIQVYLYNREPKRWSDKRNIQLAAPDGGPIQVKVDGKGKLISALNSLASRAGKTDSDKQPES